MPNQEKTQKDIELYKGVNTANPPHHDKLVPGWMPPEPPKGFHNLVAILTPVTEGVAPNTHIWELDYLDTERSSFASEELEFEVTWPWVSGFVPKPQDWDEIGIPHLK